MSNDKNPKTAVNDYYIELMEYLIKGTGDVKEPTDTLEVFNKCLDIADKVSVAFRDAVKEAFDIEKEMKSSSERLVLIAYGIILSVGLFSGQMVSLYRPLVNAEDFDERFIALMKVCSLIMSKNEQSQK